MHVEGSRTLAAKAGGGEDLARVADPVRVEGAPQELHDVHVVGGEHLGHVLHLVAPDAVLARERPTVLQAGEDDLPGQLFGLVGLTRGVVVVEDERVEVAVAGVEDVGDPEAVLFAQVRYLLQYGTELRARDDPVLDVVIVGDGSHRPECSLPALPEQGALLVVLGDPNLRGVVVLTDLNDLVELALHLGLGAVELDDQDGPRFGKAGRDLPLHRLDGQRVHHLDGCRNYPAADDPRYRPAGLLRVLEGREQCPYVLGLAQDPERYLGSDAQGSFRADEGAEEFVAGGVGRLAAADVDDRAVGQYDLGPHHVVCSKPVLEAVDTARILGEVPADGGDDLARRVGGVVVALVRYLLGDPDVYDAGLDDDPPVRDVDLEDAAQPGKDYEDAGLDGESPTREPCSRAPGHERDAFVVAGLDYQLDLLSRLGEDGEVGNDAVVHEAVALVSAQLFALVDHTLRTENLLHGFYQLSPVHVCPSLLGALL